MDAGPCGGVRDVMERCGGGGAAKNVAPLSGGLLLKLERELVGAESTFPIRPGLVCAWETIPVRALFRKASGGEEGAVDYGRQPFIVDWKRRPDRFSLRLLEPVKIFRYSWILGPLAEGCQEEGDNVCGLETVAAALKAHEEVL